MIEEDEAVRMSDGWFVCFEWVGRKKEETYLSKPTARIPTLESLSASS